MTITVLTKSMGRRSFDGVVSIKNDNTHIEIRYYTQMTYNELIRIPLEDVNECYAGDMRIIFDTKLHQTDKI